MWDVGWDSMSTQAEYFIMIVVLHSKKIISIASYSTEVHDARGTVGLYAISHNCGIS